MFEQPSKEKEEVKAFSNEWKRLHNLPWLFPEPEMLCQSADYLEYFSRIYGSMMMSRCPLNYRWEYLEKNKNKIAFSKHLITENGIVAPYTMLQYGPRFHVAADWIWNEDKKKFFVTLNIFHVTHQEYNSILNDNTELEYVPEEENNMGFGGFSKFHESSVK